MRLQGVFILLNNTVDCNIIIIPYTGIRRIQMANYDKDSVQRRLRRIEGQIKGIQKMIDEERGCNDILIQISAVRSAVNRVGGIVLENHLNHCMKKCKNEGNEGSEQQTIDELIETMIGFLK